ncbi:hypothetical protein P3T23_009382 [Paraburkholderia sp. GAS448]
MARTEATLPGGARLADYLTVGYLALNCSLGQVKEALATCGVQTVCGATCRVKCWCIS